PAPGEGIHWATAVFTLQVRALAGKGGLKKFSEAQNWVLNTGVRILPSAGDLQRERHTLFQILRPLFRQSAGVLRRFNPQIPGVLQKAKHRSATPMACNLTLRPFVAAPFDLFPRSLNFVVMNCKPMDKTAHRCSEDAF